MPSRDLSLCCSIVRNAVPRFKARFEAVYPLYEIRVLSTLRFSPEQENLYAIGRTEMGKDPSPERPMGRTVTNADGVKVLSNHQAQEEHGEYACHACDLGIFVRATGAYVQDDGPYEVFRPIAEECGLKSGWVFPLENPKFKADPDHVECDVTKRGATQPPNIS